MKIIPSLLSADFYNLEKQLSIIRNYDIESLHFDVMDGHYVQNITFGLPVLKSLVKHTNFGYEVHLMIDNPWEFTEEFLTAGADTLYVHTNAFAHFNDIQQKIVKHRKKIGLVINPEESFEKVKQYLGMVDVLLCMGVNPGKGGQTFLDSVYQTISEVVRYKKDKKMKFLIEVDGGVCTGNLKQLETLHVDLAVAGSAVFKNGEISKNLHVLFQAIYS